MSVSTEGGRLRCTVTNTTFGPDFNTDALAEAFLAFIGYYPPNWRALSSFSPNGEHDPRSMSEDDLTAAHARFQAHMDLPPSRRPYRTLVHLFKRDKRVYANLPAWAPRVWMELDVIGRAGFDVVTFTPQKRETDDLSCHAIPEAVANELPEGATGRTHCPINIGAKAWDGLLWPSKPEAWEMIDLDNPATALETT